MDDEFVSSWVDCVIENFNAAQDFDSSVSIEFTVSFGEGGVESNFTGQ